jgi:hypothetical protein
LLHLELLCAIHEVSCVLDKKIFFWFCGALGYNIMGITVQELRYCCYFLRVTATASFYTANPSSMKVDASGSCCYSVGIIYALLDIASDIVPAVYCCY